jgi:AraC family transcriptional regulator
MVMHAQPDTSSMGSSALALLARLVDVATSTNGRQCGQATNSQPVRGGLAPWQARRVAAYIEEHVGRSIRASQLAALVNLSNSHFNRAFKVSFRDTPVVYIMRQRMRVAKDMMLTTRQPLSQIALQCGLCDQAHFSRMFRRFAGLSPRLWRRQFCTEMGAPRGPLALSQPDLSRAG